MNGNLILIFLGHEYVVAGFDFSEHRLKLSRVAILGMDVKYGNDRTLLLRDRRKREVAKSGRKKRERCTFSKLAEEFSSAKVDRLTNLPAFTQRNIPRFLAESEI